MLQSTFKFTLFKLLALSSNYFDCIKDLITSTAITFAFVQLQHLAWEQKTDYASLITMAEVIIECFFPK